MTTNIAVLISGSGSNLQALIDAVDDQRIPHASIRCVISNKEDAKGLERARNSEIEALFCDASDFPREEYTAKIIKILTQHHIDLVCLAGFMLILSPSFIRAFPYRVMNIHPALLPSFGGKGMYGHHVHEAVIASAEKFSGATVHFVDEGCDTGPIILQEKIPVDPCDTPLTLAKKVLALEHRLYPEAVRLFVEGKLEVIENKVQVKL